MGGQAEAKAPKMISKCFSGTLPEQFFHHRGPKRRTFTKLRYLPSKTHLGRVPGPLFFVPFLQKCRPSCCKDPHLQKNWKKGAPKRPRGRQRSPKVVQSGPNWRQKGTQNDPKIHPLGRCLPRGGPHVTLGGLGYPPLSQRRLFGYIFLFLLYPRSLLFCIAVGSDYRIAAPRLAR